MKGAPLHLIELRDPFNGPRKFHPTRTRWMIKKGAFKPLKKAITERVKAHSFEKP